jgi:hypothetical protein
LSAVVNLVPTTFVMPLVGGGQIADQANDGMLAWRAMRGHGGVAAWRPGPAATPAPAPRGPQPTPGDERALAVITHAISEAIATGAGHLGTEHLLCGLANADDQCARLLASRGVSIRCRGQAEDKKHDMRSVPQTPRLRKAMERARSSLSLSASPRIEPEHMLLGLLGDPKCCAAADLGARAEALRADVIARLAARAQPVSRAASSARS